MNIVLQIRKTQYQIFVLAYLIEERGMKIHAPTFWLKITMQEKTANLKTSKKTSS